MKRAQSILWIFAFLFLAIQGTEAQLPDPNVFAIRGTVFGADGTTPVGNGFSVTVKNVTKGLSGADVTGETAGDSQYVVTFLNLTDAVVSVDDLIEVTVTQPPTDDVLATNQVSVTASDISAGSLIVDVKFPSSSDRNHVFAVLGQILLPNNLPAGDGLTVTVENITKKIDQTDITGKFAGPSQYVVTFVNTETPVAEVGDELEVRVTDAAGGVLGSKQVTLSADAVSAGLQRIDVELTEIGKGTHVFGIRGTVFEPDGTTPAGDRLRVTVENSSNGLSRTDVTGAFAGPSQYVTTFLDIENLRVGSRDTLRVVAEAGDKIIVNVEDASGNRLGAAEKELTPDDINAGSAQIDVMLTTSPPPPPPPEVTLVFAVRGTIFVYDNTTPAGDGLTVSVNNTTKNLTATDTTGATAGPSQYVVSFVSTDTSVADPGNSIQVQVRDGRTSIFLGEATVVIGEAEITAGSVTVDVRLPSFPWDANKDRVINIFDLVIVAGSFGKQIPDPQPTPNPDINRDGVVNIFDLVIIAGHFGERF